MAEPRQRGRFSRVINEIVDRAFTGNRGFDYNRGVWNRRGAIQGGVQSGLGAINPLLGQGARIYFNWANSRRNPSITPVTAPNQIPFTPGSWTTSGPLPFQGTVVPDGQMPPAPSTAPQRRPAAPATQRRPPTVRGYGGPMGVNGVQMGGARGARSWGGRGITGDAARAFMEGIHMSGDTIYTGGGGQRLY